MVTIVQQLNENEQRRRKQTIERAKANHLSRQLQMRLQYARIKVEHGWQRQTLNEVENLYFTKKNPKQTGGHLAAPPVATFPSPPAADQYTAVAVAVEGMEGGVGANTDVEAVGTGVVSGSGTVESQLMASANGRDGVHVAATASPPLTTANPPLWTDSPGGTQVQLTTPPPNQQPTPPPVLALSYQSSPQPPLPLSQSQSTYYPQAQYQFVHPQHYQQPSLDYYPSQPSNQQPSLHLGHLPQASTQFIDMLASSGSGSSPWPKSGTALPSSQQQPPPTNAFSNSSSSLTYDSFWSGFRSGSVTPAPLQSAGKIPGSFEQTGI